MNLIPASRSFRVRACGWPFGATWMPRRCRTKSSASEHGKSDACRTGQTFRRSEQVLRRRPVATNGLERRSAHVVMSATAAGDPESISARNSAPPVPHFQLAVDLGRHLPGLISVGTHPWAASLAVLTVAQIPYPSAAKDRTLPTRNEAFFLSLLDLPRESSRYKTPQKPPQTGSFGETQKRKCPCVKYL